MSLFDGIGKFFAAKKVDDIRTDELTVDIDKETEDGITASQFVSYVNTELERRRNERYPFELQWMLNSNFLQGHQYCDINTYKGEIEDIESEYDYLEKGVYNRIAPLYDTRMANLRNVKYSMTVRPATAELDDLGKAEVSTKLLRATQNRLRWDSFKDKVYGWSELCGTAFILSYWDIESGREICGEKEGNLECGLITPYEVFPENIYKEDVTDQRNIIVDQVMSVEDIYDKFGVRADGKDCDTYIITPIPGAGSYGQGTFSSSVIASRTEKVHNSEHVISYYEPKSKLYPNGRFCVIIGDKVIHNGVLPYSRIPIISVKCKSVAGQFFGKSFIQDLIPLQRAYNGCKNMLHDYIKSATNEPLLVPQGSVENIDELIEQGVAPNQIVEYRQDFNKPEYLGHKGIPTEVITEMNQLVADMEYSAGISQLMVYGNTPGGVTSGTAIEHLRQIDNTRLSLTAENMRNSIKELAVLWLSIYKTFAKGYRVTEIVGENDVGDVLVWCGDEINSFDVIYDTTNELQLSEEQQKENFLQAYQLGLFADENGIIPREVRERAIEMLRVGNYSALMTLSDEQRQNAKRENAFLEAGIIPEIDKYDDDEIHIAEHKKFALQYRFKRFRKTSPALCDAFDNHIAEHEQRLQQIAMQQQAMMQR